VRKAQLISILLFSGWIAHSQYTNSACTRSCGQHPPPPGSSVTLYNFAGQPDGADPEGNLVEDSAGNLYGTTNIGGTSNLGTVFRLNKSGETVLYSFSGPPDGANPQAGLVLDSAGNLYGTTANGGMTGGMCPVDGCGIVFKVDPSGKETILYSFTAGNADGAVPLGSLVRDASGNLFGTTSLGGPSNAGTVFKLDSSGKETVLYAFNGAAGVMDGVKPAAGLIMDSSGNLYGTTEIGGRVGCRFQDSSPVVTGCGTVFKVDTAGKETVLYLFAGGNKGPDGAFPEAGLVRDAAGNLYGTTLEGGAGVCDTIPNLPPQPPGHLYCGTVFKLDATGTETLLHEFTPGTDGASPQANLVFDQQGNLYGTTFFGGVGQCIESGTRPDAAPVIVGCGSIFKIDPNGNETVLFDFDTSSTGGTGPRAGLIIDSAGTLFGTTNEGGTSNSGTVFAFNPAGTTTTFALSVTLAGNGSGMVTSNPSGINCGGTCSASFDQGSVVQLSESPSAGSTFSGWSGACSGSGSCMVTLSAAESVTATFTASAAPDFSLTASPTTLVVQPGSKSTDTITITPENGPFTNAIQLTCSVTGPSPMPGCGLLPNSVVPQNSATNSTLTVDASGLMARVSPISSPNAINARLALLLPLWGVAVFGWGLNSGRANKRRHMLWLVLGLASSAIVFQFGCGGGSNPVSQSRTYTITVAAAAPGGIQHTAQVLVTVP
jgi:uncharacterized repeat protein (TIGR03803 family)